jgi:hypothetical protein
LSRAVREPEEIEQRFDLCRRIPGGKLTKARDEVQIFTAGEKRIEVRASSIARACATVSDGRRPASSRSETSLNRPAPENGSGARQNA